MYNAEQKQRYIENCRYEESTIEALKVIFNNTEQEENIFNKDVSDFNQEEVVDYLKSLNSKSPNRLKTTCNFISDYRQWCLDEGLITNIINPFDKKVTDIIIEQLIPKESLVDKYINKETMLQYLEEITTMRSKLVTYALYIGIKGSEFEEIRYLRIEDLDYKNETVQLCTGRKVKVDKIFMDLISEVSQQTDMEDDLVSKDAWSRNLLKYMNSPYVLKSMDRGQKEDVITRNLVTVAISKAKYDTGNELLNAATLYKSGLINYIKEKYTERGITLKEAFLSQINGKLYTYDTDTTKYIQEFGAQYTTRALRRELREYLENHNCF